MSRKEIIITILVAAFIGIGTSLSVYSRLRSAPVQAVAHTVPQMPTQIDVNGVQWRIQVIPTMGQLLGHTDCARRLIFIAKEAQDKHEVIIHELSHASVCYVDKEGFDVLNLYFNSSDNDKHEGIYHFSGIWAEILLRNPDLAAYLGSPLESSK